jgi:glycosyltransferase involved in cell wall biosynthesis
MYPKITIITPSYNQGRYLEETILSVLNQNYPSLEYIIIDGGSTDTSVDIIKKYASRLAWWVSEKDKGTYDAINKALKRFTGEYWCVVNSDDTLKPNTLKEVALFIENNNNKPDWITGGIEFIDEHSEFLGKSIPIFPSKVAGMYFLKECWIYHPVTFLSRKLYEAVGDFNRMDIMDYDYWIRAEEVGFTPLVVSKVLGSLRYHDDCKSMNFLKINRAKIDLFTGYREKVKDKKLLTELQEHIKDYQLSYYQSELKLLLYNKQYIKTAWLLLVTLLKYPVQFLRKWPYGLVRRFFSGIEEKEFSPKYFVKNMN